ncbi:hypothetical protein [Desulfomarina sp.]
MNSLKKLVWLAFLLVGGLLMCIALLAVYQYRLTGNYNAVIAGNGRILFHFMTIREGIIEAFITGKEKELIQLIPDLEQLNSELFLLKENNLVAPELKLALADKVDLPGMVILLRQAAGDDNPKTKKKLQEQMRFTADYLIQYDRIIAGQARLAVINFQKMVIGVLGLIISLAGFALIHFYRNTLLPLLQLQKNLEADIPEPEAILPSPPVTREVADLAFSVQQLVIKVREQELSSDPAAVDLRNNLEKNINETINRLNGIMNYAQLLHDGEKENQNEMLQKIIDSSAVIAAEWRKLN